MRVAKFFLPFMLLTATAEAMGGKKGGKKGGGKKCGKKKSKAKGGVGGGNEGEAFDSGFYIAYVGPEEKFNVNNFDAIGFLQNSVQDTYNTEIGCDAEIFAGSVELKNQTLLSVVDSGERRRLQRQFGLTFSLLNFYTVKGTCGRTCPQGNRLVGNDAGRRHLRRLPESDGVDNFNLQIVTVLNQREEFSAINEASITNDSPPTHEMSESEDFRSDFEFLSGEPETSNIVVVSNSDDPYRYSSSPWNNWSWTNAKDALILKRNPRHIHIDS